MNAKRNVDKPAVIQEVTYRERRGEVRLQDDDQPELTRWPVRLTIRGNLPPAAHQRPVARRHLRAHRARLHDGVRRAAPHQLRPRRRLHARRVRRLLTSPTRSSSTRNPSVLGAIVVTIGAMAVCAVVGILIERLAYRPVRASFAPHVAHHRHRRVAAARVRRAGRVRRHAAVLSADDPVRRPTRSAASRSPTRACSSSSSRSS